MPGWFHLRAANYQMLRRSVASQLTKVEKDLKTRATVACHDVDVDGHRVQAVIRTGDTPGDEGTFEGSAMRNCLEESSEQQPGHDRLSEIAPAAPARFTWSEMRCFRTVVPGSDCKPLKSWSGRRESNPQPTAWKAVTLPLSYSRPGRDNFIVHAITGRVRKTTSLSRCAA